MMPRHLIGAAAAAALMLYGGTPAGAQPLNIPFAPNEDPKLVDPDSPAKKFRVDFARVEHEFPLARADLMKLTPENVAELSQEQVDQIYARLTAGPIPDGPYRGTLFFRQGDTLNARLEEILGGVPGRLAARALELGGRGRGPPVEGQGVRAQQWPAAQHDREQSVAAAAGR